MKLNLQKKTNLNNNTNLNETSYDISDNSDEKLEK